MSRNWWADKYHLRDSVDATLDAMTRTDYEGQFRMERFIGYGELPDIICSAAEEAGKMVLGKMFSEVNQYGRGSTVCAFIHRPRRDTRDQGLGEVSIHFNLRAKGGWKWWTNIDRHLAAFETIMNHMRSRVVSRYPDAQCYMTHDMSGGGYDFRVVVTPAMPYGLAA